MGHEITVKYEVVVRLKGGTLKAVPSPDSNYPGILVKFEPDNENAETLSQPSILIEEHEDSIRALVWGDASSEDYTKEIKFL